MGKPIHALSTTPTILVAILTVITLWLYPLWWFYTRTREINDVAIDKLKFWNLGLLSILSFTLLFLDFYWPEAPSFAVNLLQLASLVTYIIIVFNIKTELEGILAASGVHSFHLSFLLSFLLSPIYFQYKINSAIEEQ